MVEKMDKIRAAHRAQHSSIAILLDNFYRRYLLRMCTILSLSACDSFLQMK